MSVEQLTSFFAWCTVINFIWMAIAAVFVMTLRDWIMDTHSRIFGIARDALPVIYMKYLAYFKIGVILFNLTPYLALRLVV